jgi:DNA replication protein
MEQFKGFPARSQFTAVPNAFFSTLLPQISDIAELKVTLHIFQTLYQKRGYPRFTSYQELLANKSLMSSLKEAERTPEEALHKALAMAVKRGTILQLALDRDGRTEDIYLLNDEPGRQTKTRIESGEINLSGLEPKEPALVDTEERPNIFTLYEQNIGMLTPMIREELVDALKVYSESWIGDAIKEAVNQNIRKKSYILAILERWAAEGRDDGTYRGDSKKTGPDKYIKGKYGHIVQR